MSPAATLSSMMEDEKSASRRGPWSQSEDRYLMELVATQGALNWVKISAMLESRTPKQCRERYHQNLKPNLNHEPISAEEGALIEKWVSELGKRWAEIARRLHNRSDNAVKNWWNGSMNRRRRLVSRSRRLSAYDEAAEHQHHHHHHHHHHQQQLQLPRFQPPMYSQMPAPTPAPLRLHPVVTYPQYVQYHASSPTSGRFPTTPGTCAWSPQSGLASPALVSPGTSPLQPAPSLVSDNGSSYSTSPRSGGLPESTLDLPPLRVSGASSPHSPEAESPKLPSMFANSPSFELSGLPPIRDAAESRPKDSRMTLNNLLS